MSISLTQNNISPGHFTTSGNLEQKKYDKDNKELAFYFHQFYELMIFLYFDFPLIVDTGLLTERKTVLYTTITQAQKVAGSLIVSCEIYKPHHNLILRTYFT